MRWHRVRLKGFGVALFGATIFVALPAETKAAATKAQDLVASGQALLMADPKGALNAAVSAQTYLPDRPKTRSEIELSARADWVHAAALISLDRAPEALPILKHGLNSGIAAFRGDEKLNGDLAYAYGTALGFTGKFDLALSELRRAYEIYARARQPRGQALALQNIAMIYVQARDYDHALQYFAQSADTFKSDPALLLSIANNEGVVFTERQQFDRAIPRYETALRLARTMNSPMLQVRALASLAEAQLSAGQVREAEASVNEGLRLSASVKSPAWRSALYTAAANVALRKRALDQAAEYIDKALDAGGANTFMLRDEQRTAYQIFKDRGEARRALDHLEAFKKLDDQARQVAASANAALMSAQFEFANQQASIAQLETTRTQNEAKIARSQRTILLILLAGTGIVTTLLLFGFISIRRSRDQVRAANEELSGTNVELERALTARTEFLATTSHEIRTPLNGILGMTQVLLADRALDGAVKSKIELVHGAGETMRALVDDILDVAKMTTGQLVLRPEEMDLHRLLRATSQVWEAQAESKGISIALDLAECPDRIVQDEVRLRQIVFNLMANAVKFTARGEVRMTAMAVEAPEGERLRIFVKDTGIGIPDDKLEEIFESFRQVDSGTTRQHGGTGLGLAICRNLAKAMGGDITVSSILGAGATFTLDIPLVRAHVPVAIATAQQGTLESAKLLLVEGNPLSQSIMRAVLSAKVAQVTIASNVEEARGFVAGGGIDLLLAEANTIGRDVATMVELATPILQSGGRAVLTWPAPDEAVIQAAQEGGLSKLIATPIAAPDLVSALASLYEPAQAPEEIAA